MKKIAIIPTLCTLGNAACGFAAIVYAAHFNPVIRQETAVYISGWLIFAAMIFDVLDGYLARLSKTASDFGTQLDSLCDAVSFGAAPGFLLIRLASGTRFQENRLMWDVLVVIATLYMLCAILRLARFNVQTTTDPKSHRSFRGLPSPAAAGCVASLAVMQYDFADRWYASHAIVGSIVHWAAPIITLAAALLMVSRLPYAHLAGQILSRRRHSFRQLVQLLMAVFFVLLFRELALVLMFWLYALSGPVTVLINRTIRRRPQEEPAF